MKPKHRWFDRGRGSVRNKSEGFPKTCTAKISTSWHALILPRGHQIQSLTPTRHFCIQLEHHPLPNNGYSKQGPTYLSLLGIRFSSAKTKMCNRLSWERPLLTMQICHVKTLDLGIRIHSFVCWMFSHVLLNITNTVIKSLCCWCLHRHYHQRDCAVEKTWIWRNKFKPGNAWGLSSICHFDLIDGQVDEEQIVPSPSGERIMTLKDAEKDMLSIPKHL